MSAPPRIWPGPRLLEARLIAAPERLSPLGACSYAQIDFPEYDDSSGTANVNMHVFQKAQRTDLSKVLAQLQVSGSDASYILEKVRLPDGRQAHPGGSGEGCRFPSLTPKFPNPSSPNRALSNALPR